jgi:hypothetical protein
MCCETYLVWLCEIEKQSQAVQDCVLKLVECQATMAVTTKTVCRTDAIAEFCSNNFLSGQ